MDPARISRSCSRPSSWSTKKRSSLPTHAIRTRSSLRQTRPPSADKSEALALCHRHAPRSSAHALPPHLRPSTEAIEEAAQDDDYVYDSSWLPWETEQASYVHIDDQDKAEKRKEQQEDQPGILLFRRPLPDQNPGTVPVSPFEDGLAVLIVGEEPTGGIHRRQFENALNGSQHCSPTPR